jgi:hypothetical protein
MTLASLGFEAFATPAAATAVRRNIWSPTLVSPFMAATLFLL